MRFDILTIFPELFEPFLTTSLIGRANTVGLFTVQVHAVSEFASDKHRTIDDTPYGGGPGMVMKVEPVDKALQVLNDQLPITNSHSNPDDQKTAAHKRRIAVLSARGEQFTQAKAEAYARLDQLVLICGRYEGIDQRVADYLADEELSIGPYVLAGGEVAALVVVEAVARLIPGVVGNPLSLKEESFTPPSPAGGDGVVEYPQYTKPAEYKGWKVPEVLLSGNHEEIRKWREAHRRPT